MSKDILECQYSPNCQYISTWTGRRWYPYAKICCFACLLISSSLLLSFYPFLALHPPFFMVCLTVSISFSVFVFELRASQYSSGNFWTPQLHPTFSPSFCLSSWNYSHGLWNPTDFQFPVRLLFSKTALSFSLSSTRGVGSLAESSSQFGSLICNLLLRCWMAQCKVYMLSTCTVNAKHKKPWISSIIVHFARQVQKWGKGLPNISLTQILMKLLTFFFRRIS